MGIRVSLKTPSRAKTYVRKAIFLDRDGVINRAVVRDGRPYPPQNDDEFIWMPSVHDTLSVLHSRGYLLIVVTNQPDVARGVQSAEQVERFHRKILDELPVEEVYSCAHDDGDGCDCRKPKPGMIVRGGLEHDVELSHSWVVGDRWRDIEAGRSAGCRTVFVQHGYAERQPENPDYQVSQISELLNIIS